MTHFLIRLFIKDRENTQNARVREQYGQFASGVGIVSNILLFVIKLVSGMAFNSVAIIADAVNNLSDSTSSLITLIGFKLSGKPADSEHPYGHARMEYLSGLFVSFFIIMLGIQLIQKAFMEIIHPEVAGFNLLTIAILIFSILIKLWQCLFYRKIAKTIDSVTLYAVSTDSLNDILATSVILIGTVITLLTGYNLDGYMGVAVAGFIMVSGVKLVLETTSPLLGTAPSEELVQHITEKIMRYESIIDLHDLTVHNYGHSRCYASVHCELPAEQDILVSHDIIDRIERDFMTQEGIHLVIHLDPVVMSDERTNRLQEKVVELIQGISPDFSIHDFRVVWGLHLSKLIFDVSVPYSVKWSDAEVVRLIEKEICQMDDTFQCIIMVDRH